MTDEEMQNPENWDFDKAEEKPGRSQGRAIVSVAFSREDFNLVSQHAKMLGLKTSELIRNATLEQITSTTILLDEGTPPDSTKASWGALTEDENKVTTAA